MFEKIIFRFPVMHNSLHRFFGCYVNNFTILPISERDIISLSNFIFKNTFVILEWVTNDGTEHFKAK